MEQILDTLDFGIGFASHAFSLIQNRRAKTLVGVPSV